jgi:hypothetical protein
MVRLFIPITSSPRARRAAALADASAAPPRSAPDPCAGRALAVKEALRDGAISPLRQLSHASGT